MEYKALTPVALCRTLSGATVVAMLVFAPLNYGSTRPGGIELLWLGCALAVGFWCSSLVVQKRLPALPYAVWLFSALLLFAALPWGLGCIQPTDIAPFTRGHFAAIAARWPQCIVWWDRYNQIGLIAGLAFLIPVVSDLARTRAWMMAFAATLLITGVIVAVVAFTQNLLHATSIYGQTGPEFVTHFCGPFYHHTTAGAYLNSVWPMGLSLAWMGWSARGRSLHSVFAGLATIATVTLLAAHTAHVSRMPQVIAIAALPLFLLLLVRHHGFSLQAWPLRARRAILGIAVVATLLLASLITMTGKVSQIAARWQLLLAPAPSFEKPAAKNPPEVVWPELVTVNLVIPTEHRGRFLGVRQVTYKTALQSIQARPWLGHGPANWMGAASQYSDDPLVRTFFQLVQFTHQDLLQFAVEWGVVGAIGWWGLLAGSIVYFLSRTQPIIAKKAPPTVAIQPKFSPAGSRPSPIVYGAATGLAALLLQSQWDFPLQMAAVTLNAVVLAGLCWSPAASEQPSQFGMGLAKEG